MDKLNTRKLLELAVGAADNMTLTAKRLEKDKMSANKANALTNAYRSAGNLYLAIAQAIDGATVTVRGEYDPTELTQADRERLDKVAKLLSE